MKTYIKTIFILMLGFFTLPAMAGNPTRFFEKLSSEPNYDYSFVSPTMLKAMGDRLLTEESYGSLPV